jgi:3-oxoadipate enol-lactonase
MAMPIVDVGGVAVEYERTGAGPDLLLLHSLLTEMTVFERVLPALAAHYRVTRFNMPGFGGSQPVALESVAESADHVARVMRAFRMPPDTTVFGNGFGAFVAAELAIRHGPRLGGLVIADVLASFPEPARVPFRAMAEKVSAGGMAAVLDAAIGRMFPPAFAQAHPEIVGARRAALAMVSPECFARACRALATLDLAPRADALRVRTLVACGALDQTTPPEGARAFAAMIPGAVYREIPDSGHCPMLEQPEALVALIREFHA